MNNEKPKNEKGLVKAFASYYKPHKKLFALDMLCSLMIALIDLSFPVLTRYAMNNYLTDKNYKMFYLFMGIIVTTFLFRILFQYFVQYHGHCLGVNIEGDMRQEVFAHLQKMSFSFYDKNRTGNLMSRILNDLFEVTELAHHGPEDLFISVVTLGGSLIILFNVNWKLTLALFSLIPIIVIFTVSRRQKISKVSTKFKEKTGVVNTAIESSITGVRVMKAFTNEEHELGKFNDDNKQYMHARKSFFKEIGVFGAGVDFLTNMMNLIIIAFGGFLIMNSQLDFTDLTMFILYIGVFLQPIRRLGTFVEEFTIGTAGFKRFREILNTQPEIVDSPKATEISDVKGDIVFNNVTFSYNDDVDILANINLEIKAGSTVALVGPSGGGKSTLCHLIPRFYETAEGSITLDGRDIKDVTLQSLRRNIGIVQQDVLMFADTILENIRYGRMEATDEQVVEAAKYAEIHNDIMSFPGGYDTIVGERGTTLSGGQKQRISIARIFLKNPPVLILDEATSALDSVTELQIQHSLDALSRGRTTLIIAHRLSTIREADTIIYIDSEGIKEQGTHQQLLDQNRLYHELYYAQFAIED